MKVGDTHILKRLQDGEFIEIKVKIEKIDWMFITVRSLGGKIHYVDKKELK